MQTQAHIQLAASPNPSPNPNPNPILIPTPTQAQTQLDIQRMVNTHLNELVENKPCKKTEERNVPSPHGMAPRVFCARNVRMTSQYAYFTYFYT